MIAKAKAAFEALNKVATQLRNAGAEVPAINEGTIESAMRTGLSIALLLVETEMAAIESEFGPGFLTQITGELAYHLACGEYESSMFLSNRRRNGWNCFSALSAQDQAFWVAHAVMKRAASPESQRKPLTPQQIVDIAIASGPNYDGNAVSVYKFARAIEAAHGITDGVKP